VGSSQRETWAEDALCLGADGEMWFEAVPVAAVRICRQCPVAAECLGYALARPDLDGVWGGTTPKERKRLRRTARPPVECPVCQRMVSGYPGQLAAHLRRNHRSSSHPFTLRRDKRGWCTVCLLRSSNPIHSGTPDA
jgi:WhiB family redox-sensing transcriptional regulator